MEHQPLSPDCKLSWSAFEKYEACPLSFYYNYVLKVWGRNNPYGLSGTAQHTLFAHVYETQNFDSKYIYAKWPSFLEKELRTTWKQPQYGHLTKADQEQAKSWGFYCIKRFLETIESNNLKRKSHFTELKIDTEKYRGQPVTVNIDAAFDFPEGFALVDWKSGKAKRDHLYQLVLYAAVYQRAKQQEVTHVAPVYFDQPVRPTKITPALAQEATDYIDVQFDGIKAGKFDPKKHEYCDDCVVKLKKKCPLWDKQPA